mgnify:CR=1 FL=1
MSKPTIIRRVRTLCSPAESQAIIDALVAGTVPDTRGFGPSGMRVAEFVGQHAAGGKYAALYPAPAEDTDSDEPDPFLVVTSSLVCEMWQFDYGDEVHAHVLVSDGVGFAAVPARPFRNAGLSFIGTCSRHTADTDSGTDDAEGDDYLYGRDDVAGYFFGRDDTAASDRVFFHVSELSHSIGPYIASGPDIPDSRWDGVVNAPAPGTDLVHDATGSTALVEAVYMTTPK